MPWLAHVLGLDSASGPWYLWWSGVCGDLSLLGAAAVVIRRHQCHVRRCWRIGRHGIDGYVVCRRHHPALPTRAPTAADVAALTEKRDP